MFAVELGDGARLEPLEPRHAGELIAHMDRGREFIGRHIGLADAVADLESAHNWLQSYAEKAAADTGRLYGIRLDGLLVGGVLFRVFNAATGSCEAGCWLEPSATGRGLVTRACRVIIDWAVRERGMHRVEWLASSANLPSLKVAERLGMTRDGILREDHSREGVRRSTEIWSVLAPEWLAANGT
jgi:RimJ/RimL family protein N-acetyltransferase